MGVSKKMKSVLAVLLVCFALFVLYSSANPIPARGWNDNIEWYSWEEGLKVAKASQKPMMVVLHKTWCGACKRLKPDFAANKEIEALSKKFVMVNAEDDEAPHDNQAFAHDGGYIPRVYFCDSDGVPDYSIYNTEGSPQYKYFYGASS